jgi:isoquinoline 1-oxidoreductase subunit beta
MSRARTIARRTFLVGSAAVAGGAAFGIYAYNRTPPNPLIKGLKNGEAALTPYVRVDQGGVTIITPRADIGQGAYSVLAALVAEELDLDWKDIKVEPGPPSAVYYNGKVLAEGLPVAATDEGLIARNARLLGDVAGKFLGMQVTGGSSTVADAYEKMRMAGATAREALLLVAAKETGIARSNLSTRDGAVITPDGRTLSYASLAASAATIDLPANVPLKPAAQWRYLGKPMRRIDMVAKSTGTAIFGIDLKMPGMVYATVRTNPRLGGRLQGYDASAAEKARGVIKIVPIAGGVGVIADNTWRAFTAADLIKFDWGPAPYPATTAAMFETVARSFRGRRDSRCKNDGDVEAALRGPGVIQAEYRVPYLAHAPLEPMNVVVQLKDGRLDIWTGTQIPRMLVAAAASMTGLPEENVHLHAQISGGSFGRRLEDDYVRQAVELAKAFQDRPIKMTWTREEDMTHDFPRPLGMARARGAVKNGEVDSYDLSIAYPSVTASQLGRQNMSIPLLPDIAIVAGAWDQPFRIPNYRVTGYRAPEMVPVSSWRSVGASGNGFIHDCFLDELIHAAGADPLKERIRLCWHEPSRKVLEAVGEMSNWGSDPGKDRGRGVAFTLSFGVPVAEVVEVTKTERDRIRIDKVFVALDVGKVLDPENFENQVQGGVIWGLGHAMNAEITYKDGIAQQTNYHAFEGVRLYQTPKIEVRAVASNSEIRGIGEPAVPPAAPALANAIFAATGKRIRELPLNRHIDFV